MTTSKSFSTDIAVIGLAGRFPGSRTIAEFWQNLRGGIESVSFFTDEELLGAGVSADMLRNPRCVKARAVIEEAENFDAAFFGISAREAEIMDPQHRLFLECAWASLEDAGYDPAQFRGRIGVYGGESINTYLSNNLSKNPDLLARLGPQQIRNGNRIDNLCTRVSYKLNLKGPSLTVQTACSTSLVAVHLACQSLINGECDIALAGGSAVYALRKSAYLYQEGGVGSPDGHCRAFDANAEGFVPGEGTGVVVLKPLIRALADGDHIYAVVKGSAINNDGSEKIGYTAPSIDGQAEVIAEALAVAGLEAESIGYIETHGTGTPLGDPIEIAALTQVYQQAGVQPGNCAIGSVKTNIGHLDAAAGIAGFIKTVLAIRNQEIPPSLNFSAPNPKINFQQSPFFVNTQLRSWKRKSGPLRAGVSAFGIGGTNAHVVLEQPSLSTSANSNRPWRLILLSAKSNSALEKMTANLGTHLRAFPESSFDDVAYTLQVGRHRFEHRQALVCSDREDAIGVLTMPRPHRLLKAVETITDPPIVFLFPGQGAQRSKMGHELYQSEALYREKVDYCATFLKPRLGFDLREVLYADQKMQDGTEHINQTLVAQPALFVTEYALACLWMKWGVSPKAMIGHSLGEYVAACLSGVFSLDDALELIAARAQLMQSVCAGAMIAVSIKETDIREILDETCSIAAVNADDRCVVSGPIASIEALEQRLLARDVQYRRLSTSHAFHSPMVEPILEEFAARVQKLKLGAPQIPYLSNLTGTWITAEQAQDPNYWVQHLRQTVRFADGIRHLLEDPTWVFIESGPGRSLSTLVRQNAGNAVSRVIIPSLENSPVTKEASFEQNKESLAMMTALGRLWLCGVQVNWKAFYGSENRFRCSLPSYPFERQRYWIDPPASLVSNIQKPHDLSAEPSVTEIAAQHYEIDKAKPAAPRPKQFDQIESRLRTIIADMLGIGADSFGLGAGFFELGFDSLQLMRVSQAIEQEFGIAIAFRQLFEEFSTLDSLVAHLHQHLPGEVAAFNSGALATGDANSSARSNICSQEKDEAISATAGQEGNFGPWRPVGPGHPELLTEHQRLHLLELVQHHTRRTAESKKLAQRYRSMLADNRNSVGFKRLWKEMIYPIVAEKSAGSRIWDIDGNEYIDLVMGFGVNFFGHSPRFITEAIERQLGHGIQIGPQTRLAGEVADLVCELTNSERVNFCNTGSEAVMGALRIARAVTGRSRVAIFAGSYHGISDGVLARATNVNGTRTSIPVALGIPPEAISQLVVLEYGTEQALEYIRVHGDKLAAVLVEPVQSSRPNLQPKEFLLSLRELTHRVGATLIFDEMVTGFRIHAGGAQAWFGIQADMATYGKILGGGMPIGLIAGKAKYLDAVDGGTWRYGDDSYPQANQTFLAGTFCKHPLALASAKAILTKLKEEGPALHEGLNSKTAKLVTSLNAYCQRQELPVAVNSFGSLFRISFAPEVKFGNLLFYHLLDRDIHIWEGRNCFLSTAHTTEDIERVDQAFRIGLEELQKGGFLPAHQPRVEAERSQHREPEHTPLRGPIISASERVLPMTDSQRGLWAVAGMSDQSSTAFNETINMRLTGAFQPAAFRHALQEIVRRHEILRASFSPDGASLRIAAAASINVPLIDYSLLDADQKQAHLEQWLRGEAQRPFNLSAGPLLRATIIKTADAEHYLALTLHHLITDGWSVGILQRELWTIYAAISSGREYELPPPHSYAEYAEARAARGSKQENSQDEAYWVQKFAGPIQTLDLPLDRPRPQIQTYNGDRRRIVFSSNLHRDLRKFAATRNSTLFIVLLSGFQLLLHWLSRQEDLVVGMHSADQTVLGGKNLMGFCLNTLAIRSRIYEETTISAYLDEVRRDVFAAQRHQNYPISRLIKRLQLVRDPSRPPLVSTIFNLDRALGTGASRQIPGLEITRIQNSVVFARFDLLWNVVETDSQLAVDCTFNRDLFDARTIDVWMSHYAKALELIMQSPEMHFPQLAQQLSAAENQRKSDEELSLKQSRQKKFGMLKKTQSIRL